MDLNLLEDAITDKTRVIMPVHFAGLPVDLEKLYEIVVNPPLDAGKAKHSITESWDRNFISSVYQHITNKSPISTAQAKILLKLINKYSNLLILKGCNGSEILSSISHPTYLQPPYESKNFRRSVRWGGNSCLVFRSKHNPEMTEDIKKLGMMRIFDEKAKFNREFKLWIVPIHSGNYEKAMNFIGRYNFHFDDQVAGFLANISNSIGQKSEVEVSDFITIQVKDDEFFNLWLQDVLDLEQFNV